MSHRLIASAIAAALACVSSAQASVDLIAIGSMDSSVGDLARQTAGALENGVAGNLFGGLGSGMTYAGCNTFLAVPDRGPNAVTYNTAVDNTTSYINRFQTLRIKLTANDDASAALPFNLGLTLRDTTLLSAAEPLVYGDGVAAGVGSGAPALNSKRRQYFVGRSDNFDATQLSTYARDGRLDPESIRVSNSGDFVFTSDEYGPYIYMFDRDSGVRIATIKVPAEFAVSTLSALGDTEISGNTAGRVANKGMEGLAISPDGRTLFGAMQSPLIQDGGTAAAYTRILRIDLRTGATRQYVYPLTNISTTAKPKYPTISEILAVNDHELLVDERDGKGLGDDSSASFKQVFHIDLASATDATGLAGESTLAPLAVGKTLFLDIASALTSYGYAATDIPAKLESLSFGPDVTVNGTLRHTLFIANDNDFLASITDTNHPSGISNPNQFFAFAWDGADLPNYQRQQLSRRECQGSWGGDSNGDWNFNFRHRHW
ncbi:MAG: esterase-like activity of phytase family protein [Steroidobacteraceae bacterium]